MLSTVNLFLEIFSLAILFPIVLMLINKDSSQIKSIKLFLNFENLLNNEYNNIIFVFIIIILFIIKNYLSIRIINYQSKTAYDISTTIALNMTESYIQNDYLSYKKEKKSSIIRNVITVPNDFSNFVLLSLNTIFTEILLLTIILTTFFLINSKMTLFLLITTILSLIILIKINKKGAKGIRQFIADRYSENISNLMNILNGFFEIKTSSKENFFQGKFFESNAALNEKYSFLTSKRISQSKYVEIILIVMLGTLLILFNYFSKSRTLDVIMLSLLIASATKIVPSINRLSLSFINISSYFHTIEIIEKKSKNRKIEKSKKNILDFNKMKFKNITFSYEEKIILKKINFNFQKGELIGIYGDSGSGKTTFLNILTQLTSSYQGQIFIDDILIEGNIQYKDLISYMPQDPFILDDTILNNITLGIENYDINQIHELIKDLNLDSVIKSLPQKLNTYIGNDGHNLSGGQKQRLALIRTILNNPKMLILDEVTNQLDNSSELIVLNYLKTLTIKKNIAVLVISHNKNYLNIVCNRVYQLKDGILKISQ